MAGWLDGYLALTLREFREVFARGDLKSGFGGSACFNSVDSRIVFRPLFTKFHKINTEPVHASTPKTRICLPHVVGLAGLEADDEKGTSPGDVLRELMNDYAPSLILIDEWVAYARQLHDQSDLPAGSFETHFTFAQALTEFASCARYGCPRVLRLRTQHQEFPPDCRDPDYEKRLKAEYPIHPEIFDRLYNDWSTLVRVQRTRGVLRLKAAVIHSLREKGDRKSADPAGETSPSRSPCSVRVDPVSLRQPGSGNREGRGWTSRLAFEARS
jgi:hypothetical protein